MNPYYIPEMGQAAFGGPWEELASPSFMEPGLDYLAWQVAAYRGSDQVLGDNSGEPEYTNEVFALRSYCWCDGTVHDWGIEDLCPPNFEHFASGLQVRWYKHSHRGRTQNRAVSEEGWREIIDSCIASVPKGLCEHVRVQQEHPWAKDNSLFAHYWECSRCGHCGWMNTI